jgi:hypothetical protein
MLTLLRRFVLMSIGSWVLARAVRRYPRLAFAQRILGTYPGRRARLR